MAKYPIRVGFCAPSRAPFDVSTPALAKLYFTDRGADVLLHDAVFKNIKQFAGTEAERIDSIMTLGTNSEVDLILPIRGGYGLTRILDDIDFEKLAQNNPIFCGYSDFTAFNMAYYAKTGKVSYHGPSGTDFVEQPLYFTENSFHKALFEEEWVLSFPLHEDYELNLQGQIWGGNLSMMASLVGTSYFPQIEGGILFVEDCNDRAYRIERSLMQLYMAGILAKQKAILLGDFRDADPQHPRDNDFLLKDVIAFLRKRMPEMPILTGFPLGHSPIKATVPFGAPVTLHTEKGYVVISTREHPRVKARF